MSLEERRKIAFEKLNIRPGNRVILSLDGGGVRTAIGLQQLVKIEEITGLTVYELFDMVAGCSAGAVLSTLIVAGRSAKQISEDYQDILSMSFKKRSYFSNPFLNPPFYDKREGRAFMEKFAGRDKSVGEACIACGTDYMVVAKDVWAGRQTFFSAFQQDGEAYGKYKDALLRAVVEASGSAPLYFTPLERFIDGAVTSFNNPVLPAIMQAIEEGPPGKYKLDKLTVFSFGSGFKPQYVKPKQTTDPPWSDAFFWLMWFLNESGDDASEIQTSLLRSGSIIRGVDFRRFQVSLDPTTVKLLPDLAVPKGLKGIEAESLHELSAKELSKVMPHRIDLYPLMETVGNAVAEYVVERQSPPFGDDLVNNKKQPMLVPHRGDERINVSHLSSPEWLDERPG